jgi:hypothetical protein
MVIFFKTLSNKKNVLNSPKYTPQGRWYSQSMTSPSISVLLVVPRDARSFEVGTVRVSLKILDFARSLDNLRAAQAKVKDTKAARTVKFIKDRKDEPPAIKRQFTHTICKAVTLAGTPCKSKANCGAYCKRHFFVSK